MNDDNLWDIVVSFEGFSELGRDRIAVFFNQGGDPPSFDGPHRFSVRTPSDGVLGKGLVVADFDSNGKQDVVVVGTMLAPNSGFAVMWDDSYWQSSPTVDLIAIQNGGGPIEVVKGNFNADNLPDCAMAVSDQPLLHVLRKDPPDPNPNRSFTLLANQGGVGSKGMTVADLDNDSILDLACTLSSADSVQWYRGVGDGTFALQGGRFFTTDASPFGIASGILVPPSLAAVDLVTANQFGEANGPHGNVTVLRNDGGVPLGFTSFHLPVMPIVTPPFTPKPCQVLVADFNNDWCHDIVSSNFKADTVSILVNAGCPVTNGPGIGP